MRTSRSLLRQLALFVNLTVCHSNMLTFQTTELVSNQENDESTNQEMTNHDESKGSSFTMLLNKKQRK